MQAQPLLKELSKTCGIRRVPRTPKPTIQGDSLYALKSPEVVTVTIEARVLCQRLWPQGHCHESHPEWIESTHNTLLRLASQCVFAHKTSTRLHSKPSLPATRMRTNAFESSILQQSMWLLLIALHGTGTTHKDVSALLPSRGVRIPYIPLAGASVP